MAELPENYVDPILDETVNTKKRYSIVENEDGTYTIEDVTTYTQEASRINALAFNNQNTEINGKIDVANILSTLEEVEANEVLGRVVDATVVKGINENLGYMFLSTFLSKTPLYIVSQSSPTTNRITYTATEPCLVTYWGYTSSVSDAAQIRTEINGREVSRFGTYYGTNATGSNGMSHLLNTGDTIMIFPANSATLNEMVVY